MVTGIPAIQLFDKPFIIPAACHHFANIKTWQILSNTNVLFKTDILYLLVVLVIYVVGRQSIQHISTINWM